ncbi:MAG: cytochrome c oxidase accessory protein CcoG [Verrucomicrobiota bacterium]
MPDRPEIARRPNLDSVTTINPDGSHHILHPADVGGRFTLARRLVAVLLMLVYAALPWIPINGAPAVFFDVETRHFHAFGLSLVVQDLWVLFFAISGLGFFLFVVTAVLGRIWCGWACPYTVFLDHVFRRIERWIDGDHHARRRLAAAPLDHTKITKRVIKHGLYLLVSAVIAHVFLSYFVSIPRLYSIMKQGPLAHAVSFGTVACLTGALYFCFAHFREQFCILMCPYGRLQSALTDEDTMIIGYDAGRGEPRGKATDPNAGSCIDCNRCVTVCPTGIDIRNGLQMECIGCAACIDACDDIMRKVNRPTGLVRYDSTRGLAGGRRRIFRPRLLAYGLLGLLGLAALGITAFFRAKPMNADLTRMRGPSFYVDPAVVRNHYQLRLFNKRNQPVKFAVSLENPPPGYAITGLGDGLNLNALKELARPLVVIVPNDSYKGPVTLTVKIHSEPGGSTIRRKVDFLGPNPHLFRQ